MPYSPSSAICADAAGDVLDLLYLRGQRIEPIRFDEIVFVVGDASDVFPQHLDLVDQHFQ